MKQTGGLVKELRFWRNWLLLLTVFVIFVAVWKPETKILHRLRKLELTIERIDRVAGRISDIREIIRKLPPRDHYHDYSTGRVVLSKPEYKKFKKRTKTQTEE